MKTKSQQQISDELRNLIREKRAAFDEAVQAAKYAAGGNPLPDNIQQHIQFVAAEFDSLSSLLNEPLADEDPDFIETRAEELAEHRIYVLPIHDLKIEAAEGLEDLSSWGIPEESLSLMRAGVSKLDQKEVAEAEKRSIMLQLNEDYSFWDSYVDWAVNVTNLMRLAAFSLVVIGLLASSILVFHDYRIFGFIVAGVSGAAISVLLKIPQVILYKDVLTLLAKFISRIATGIIASVVGLGLLSSKIINLVFELGDKKLTTADLICCPDNAPRPLAQITLIGIGVLFGFSERMLFSLEETLLGKLSLPERQAKKPSE